MKKTISILLSLMMVICLAACGNSAGQAERPATENNSIENGTANDAESIADDHANTEGSTENDAQTQSSNMQTETESAGQLESVNESDTENAGLSETEAPQPEAEVPETQGNKVLVAYFSATGTTEGVAEHIANGLDADIYEIIPEEPYTDADLNYNDNNSRSTIEMNDPASRPAISGSVENMEQYDIVFIGYPIWWGQAPKIMCTFMESYDFSGKTIVPFCTSGGSGISSSTLEPLTNGATWLPGRRFSGSASQSTIMEWVRGLGLNLAD